LADETSNGNKEYLAVSAKFYQNPKDTTPAPRLIALIELTESSTDINIFEKIWKLLFEGQSGEKREKCVVGISTDGARNMISSMNAGATNRLEDSLPHLIVTHDYCHALNLVIKKCMRCFPQDCVKLVEDISHMFSQSPLKAAEFRKFLNGMHEDDQDSKILAIKRYVPTRWTSFYDCLERILELEKPLKRFLSSENPESKKNMLFDANNSIILKLMQRLVGWIVEQVKLFEGDSLSSVRVAYGLKKCFSHIGEYLFDVKRESLSSSLFPKIVPYSKISREEPSYKNARRTSANFEVFFLQENIIFNNLLNGKSLDFSKNFFRIAEEFMETAFQNFQKRLPKMDSIILMGDSVIIKEKADIENLQAIAKHFEALYKEFDLFKLDVEFQNIKDDSQFIKKLQESKDNEVITVWKTKEEQYPLLYHLIEIIQLFPYSNSFS